MRRETVSAAVVAALCILALASAAATIDSATRGGAGGVGGDGNGTGAAGADNSTRQEYERGNPLASYGGRITDRLESVLCIPLLTEPPVVLAVVGLVVAGFVAVKRKYDLATATGMLTILGAPGVALGSAFYYTRLGCQTIRSQESEPGNLNGSVIEPGAGGAGGDASTQVAHDPSLLMLAIVAVALVVAVVVLVRGTGDDVASPEDELADDSLARPPGAVLAEVAGAAADRIETTGDVENEVYRAWREMTAPLDVTSPESSTPAEFRRAAVDAGMDREHVDKLTAVFEAVRYGGYEATAEREREAVQALRRIEDVYGGGES